MFACVGVSPADLMALIWKTSHVGSDSCNDNGLGTDFGMDPELDNGFGDDGLGTGFGLDTIETLATLGKDDGVLINSSRPLILETVSCR